MSFECHCVQNFSSEQKNECLPDGNARGDIFLKPALLNCRGFITNTWREYLYYYSRADVSRRVLLSDARALV